MFYVLERRHSDWPVALCATLIMALSPLFWLQSGLPLTDMFGMVFVVAFLLVEGATTTKRDARIHDKHHIIPIFAYVKSAGAPGLKPNPPIPRSGPSRRLVRTTLHGRGASPSPDGCLVDGTPYRRPFFCLSMTRTVACCAPPQGSVASKTREKVSNAVSSARLYWENKLSFVAPKKVAIPVAVRVFPDEIYTVSRSWAERAYPKLIHYNKLDKGGHFADWEQPQLFSEEVRAGFRPLRK